MPGGQDQIPTPVGPIQATEAVAESVTAAPGATTPPKPRPGDGLFVGERKPTTREQIGLSSIVLAQEGPNEGWWEAEVIGCNGRTFSLRWSDFPEQPTILRAVGKLALPPPGDA